MTDYVTTCPLCGVALTVVAQGPQSAPFLCRGCRRSWWAAELTPSAQAAYSRDVDDFAHDSGVKEAVVAEAAIAMQRGTSLRPDQVTLVPDATLQSIAGGFQLTAELGDQIANQLKGGS